MIAPFPKDRRERVESDECWWCEQGGQSRGHLFTECKWKKEIHTLGEKVGRILGEGEKREVSSRAGKVSATASEKPTPNQATQRAENKASTDAVLVFSRDAKVGTIKGGVLDKD